MTETTVFQADADPEMARILSAMAIASSSRPHASELAPEAQRRRFTEDMMFWNKEGPDLPRVENGLLQGPGGDLAYRLYEPLGAVELRPALVYFHGGGWTVGDLDSEDRQLRELALGSGVTIVSVAYRLAPEYKFPHPLEDCVAAMKWIAAEGAQLGIDRTRLAVGGLSAGANLALATALCLRDEGSDLVKFLMLFQGGYGARDSESFMLFGGGDYGLDRRAISNYYACYLDSPDQRDGPLVSPLLADLKNLPPVFLNAAGLDPLRDDSIELASRLVSAAVAVDFRLYPGVIHIFTLMSRRISLARQALRDAAEALRTALI
ncbi:alpha/beta hydrolase fold domain-containing protein [Govanella unica]|uniref:Alpha/beta hydrolase fold domain-containing protein n=1 Tax=Govanella unica TaxID=2975056 RepID=A0A9X3TW91_9PROT|nr:alpha/beta hydrolase fold domain-containing protein [Govania unica]MDA5192880.1 alpha/beta hydrolase fold domain-containing protein [Govania unica]